MKIDTKVHELRKMGLTYDEIGQTFGVKKQRIEQIIHRETYNARQRHYNHRANANPKHPLRKPCPYCD